MSITQTFDLNLIPEQAPVVVHCDQYDEGTGRLIIKLFEGDVAYTPTGTASIQGRKPDGHGFQYSATLVGNTVTADLTFQMSCVSGRVRCQVVVTESTGRTGTFAFILDVQPSALPSDTDLSDSDYQLIEQGIQAAEDALEAAEDAEAWAVGERGGVPVDPSDPTYHNNSKYWSDQAASVGDLDDLNDVTITTPSDNQVLTYDSNSGEWVNANPQAGAAALDDLTDVDITTPSNGQILQYNSTSQEWENASPSTPDIDDLGDVTITSPSDGQALLYDAINQIWKNGNVSGGGGMNTDGSNADSAVAFPSDSISSGKYAKSTGGFAFCDEMATTSDLTNSLQSIPANTTTETRILNIHINSYPVVNIWLESSNKVTATKAMTSDVTKTYNNATIRVHKEGNYIEVWATNTNSSSVYCHYTRQSYTESNHDSLSVGKATKATGDSSVSTGIVTEATGKASYAGGYHSRANNNYAHAEGFSTRAEGVGAFSIGSNSAAEGNFAFAQGSDTKASSVNQAAFGKYNIEDTQDAYAFLIGNGTSNTRSNALSVDWSGNLEVAGNVKGKFNKVTSLAVDLTGWTSDTTSQSGTTLYKKQISVNHVYVESPTVDIGASGVLPSVAEQESYNLLQYVTVDDAVPCLYLYASAIPTTAFYINVEGVD